MGKHLLFASISAAVLCATGGCATAPPVWAEYDACAFQTSSFVEMVACGKQKRMAACQAASACSAMGNAFVDYADSLAMQVTNHEISEGQARQEFAQYKTQLYGNIQRNQAIVAAGVAAGGN
jgi:hypothetical protein